MASDRSSVTGRDDTVFYSEMCVIASALRARSNPADLNFLDRFVADAPRDDDRPHPEPRQGARSCDDGVSAPRLKWNRAGVERTGGRALYHVYGDLMSHGAIAVATAVRNIAIIAPSCHHPERTCALPASTIAMVCRRSNSAWNGAYLKSFPSCWRDATINSSSDISPYGFSVICCSPIVCRPRPIFQRPLAHYLPAFDASAANTSRGISSRLGR